MRFWILLLPLLAAIGVASPSAAALIGRPERAIASDAGAGTLDDFVYRGARLNETQGAAPLMPQHSLASAISMLPEPAGWLMLIGGFGLIGRAMRRRHRAPSLGHAQII